MKIQENSTSSKNIGGISPFYRNYRKYRKSCQACVYRAAHRELFLFTVPVKNHQTHLWDKYINSWKGELVIYQTAYHNHNAHQWHVNEKCFAFSVKHSSIGSSLNTHNYMSGDSSPGLYRRDLVVQSSHHWCALFYIIFSAQPQSTCTNPTKIRQVSLEVNQSWCNTVKTKRDSACNTAGHWLSWSCYWK